MCTLGLIQGLTMKQAHTQGGSCYLNPIKKTLLNLNTSSWNSFRRSFDIVRLTKLMIASPLVNLTPSTLPLSFYLPSFVPKVNPTAGWCQSVLVPALIQVLRTLLQDNKYCLENLFLSWTTSYFHWMMAGRFDSLQLLLLSILTSAYLITCWVLHLKTVAYKTSVWPKVKTSKVTMSRHMPLIPALVRGRGR